MNHKEHARRFLQSVDLITWNELVVEAKQKRMSVQALIRYEIIPNRTKPIQE